MEPKIELKPNGKHGRPGDPCTMVIFGASGDLTKRKLLPALYNLAKKKLLAKDFALVGCATQEISQDEFRNRVRNDLKEFGGATDDCSFCDWLLERLYYSAGDFRDPATYQRLKPLLEEVEQKHGTRGNYFYYLATTPNLFGEIVQHLGAAGLTEQTDGHWRRVVIEKPFGRDLDSARLLNREIRKVLTEDQIYRIDHYLGKETVQNILVFRFSNGIFEPIWNRRYIDHVQITVAEPWESSSAEGITTRPVRCATWCRTTFCNWSRLRPWNRLSRSKPTRFAMSRPRFCMPFSRMRRKTC